MRIKQALVLCVIGDKEHNIKKWWRLSRFKLNETGERVARIPNLYYAKYYEYVRQGKKRGYVKGSHFAYTYKDKHGFFVTKMNFAPSNTY